SCRIDGDLCPHSGELEQHLQYVANTRLAPRGDVVDGAVSTGVDEAQIRACDVAHVAQIARHVEVADPHSRRRLAGADSRHLFGKRGHDEARILARSDLVEWPRENDLERTTL